MFQHKCNLGTDGPFESDRRRAAAAPKTPRYQIDGRPLDVALLDATEAAPSVRPLPARTSCTARRELDQNLIMASALRLRRLTEALCDNNVGIARSPARGSQVPADIFNPEKHGL